MTNRTNTWGKERLKTQRLVKEREVEREELRGSVESLELSVFVTW